MKGGPGDGGTKGLLAINGKPMVGHVIDALSACSEIDRILVLAPDSCAEQVRALGNGIEFLPSGDDVSLPAKIRLGLEALGGTGPVLMAAADVPLLTPESIIDFIGRSAASGGSVCYPLVPRESVEHRFPQSERTWIRLREGAFTGGNLFFVKSEVLLRNMPLIEKVYASRKSPLKLVGILGFGFLLKLLSRTLRIRDIETRTSLIIGAEGKIIITRYAEIGIDADKPADISLIETHLAGLR